MTKAHVIQLNELEGLFLTEKDLSTLPKKGSVKKTLTGILGKQIREVIKVIISFGRYETFVEGNRTVQRWIEDRCQNVFADTKTGVLFDAKSGECLSTHQLQLGVKSG